MPNLKTKRGQIIAILVQRDDISVEEAEEQFNYAQRQVKQHGRTPEDVCFEELGLEPDYAEALT